MTPDADRDLEQLKALEQALHRPSVRGSTEAVAALLADDFVEFGRSGGVYDKDDWRIDLGDPDDP